MTRAIWLTGVFAALLLGCFALADYVLGASLYWPILAGVLALGVGLGYAGLYDLSRRSRLGLVVVFASAIFAVRVVDWNSRKPFLRKLLLVKQGMTHAEVEGLMGGYLHGTGWPASGTSRGDLKFTNAEIYRHTNEGWGNSDWGVVVYENGRVQRVEFSAD